MSGNKTVSSVEGRMNSNIATQEATSSISSRGSTASSKSQKSKRNDEETLLDDSGLMLPQIVDDNGRTTEKKDLSDLDHNNSSGLAVPEKVGQHKRTISDPAQPTDPTKKTHQKSKSVTVDLPPHALSPTQAEDELLLNVEKEVTRILFTSTPMQWIRRHDTPTPPYRSICFSVFLVIIGVVFIAVAVLIFTNVIVYEFQRLYAVTPYALSILGLLLLVPGLYHIHLAIYAAAGQRGYGWDDFTT